jgi:hypothetical protein
MNLILIDANAECICMRLVVFPVWLLGAGQDEGNTVISAR